MIVGRATPVPHPACPRPGVGAGALFGRYFAEIPATRRYSSARMVQPRCFTVDWRFAARKPGKLFAPRFLTGIHKTPRDRSIDGHWYIPISWGAVEGVGGQGSAPIQPRTEPNHGRSPAVDLPTFIEHRVPHGGGSLYVRD